MKTIKITEELHKDLLKLKVEYEFKTLSETIRFLEKYHKNDIRKEKINDCKK